MPVDDYPGRIEVVETSSVAQHHSQYKNGYYDLVSGSGHGRRYVRRSS